MQRYGDQWCGCMVVTEHSQCSFSWSIGMMDDRLVCCKWFYSGFGAAARNINVFKVIRDAFSVNGVFKVSPNMPRASLFKWPQSMQRSATAQQKLPSFSKPFTLPEYQPLCEEHLRRYYTQLAAATKCSLPGQCQSNCCCAGTSNFLDLRQKAHPGICMNPTGKNSCKAKGQVCLDEAAPQLQDLAALKKSVFQFTRLEAPVRAASYNWYFPRGNGPALEPTSSAVCFVKRKTGTSGVLALGVHDLNGVVGNMTVYHWSVGYDKSPYRRRKNGEKLMTKFLFEDKLHRLEFKRSACAMDEKVWPALVTRLGFEPRKLHLQDATDSQLYGHSARVTYVLTANTGGIIELRFARMESNLNVDGSPIGSYLTAWKDTNGKHSFLNRHQDYVLWAGEAWVQFTTEAVALCSERTKFKFKPSRALKRIGLLSRLIYTAHTSYSQCLRNLLGKNPPFDLVYATIIFNNDSGTFKAAGDMKTRTNVKTLIESAIGPRAKINVCPLLIPGQPKPQADAACPDAEFAYAWHRKT